MNAEVLKKTKEDIGARIRKFRERAGYVGAESFAEALDVHVNTVYALERGNFKELGIEMMLNICEKTAVPLAAIFDPDPAVIKPNAKEALRIIEDELDLRAKSPSKKAGNPGKKSLGEQVILSAIPALDQEEMSLLIKALSGIRPELVPEGLSSEDLSHLSPNTKNLGRGQK